MHRTLPDPCVTDPPVRSWSWPLHTSCFTLDSVQDVHGPDKAWPECVVYPARTMSLFASSGEKKATPAGAGAAAAAASPDGCRWQTSRYRAAPMQGDCLASSLDF